MKLNEIISTELFYTESVYTNDDESFLVEIFGAIKKWKHGYKTPKNTGRSEEEQDFVSGKYEERRKNQRRVAKAERKQAGRERAEEIAKPAVGDFFKHKSGVYTIIDVNEQNIKIEHRTTGKTHTIGTSKLRKATEKNGKRLFALKTVAPSNPIGGNREVTEV